MPAGDNGRFGARLIAVGALFGHRVSDLQFLRACQPVRSHQHDCANAGRDPRRRLDGTFASCRTGSGLAAFVRRWSAGSSALPRFSTSWDGLSPRICWTARCLLALMGVCGVGWIADRWRGRIGSAPARSQLIRERAHFERSNVHEVSSFRLLSRLSLLLHNPASHCACPVAGLVHLQRRPRCSEILAADQITPSGMSQGLRKPSGACAPVTVSNGFIAAAPRGAAHAQCRQTGRCRRCGLRRRRCSSTTRFISARHSTASSRSSPTPASVKWTLMTVSKAVLEALTQPDLKNRGVALIGRRWRGLASRPVREAPAMSRYQQTGDGGGCFLRSLPTISGKPEKKKG